VEKFPRRWRNRNRSNANAGVHAKMQLTLFANLPTQTITLRWSKGLFLPIGGMSHLEKLAAEQAAEQLFLTLLEEFNRQGRNTSAKPNAPTYAPTLFAKEKQARKLGIKRANFEEAMRNLFAADKIQLQPYGPPSKATSKLVHYK
jgi:hypothetical protein